MSEPAGTVRRWVPRNLYDHGMILASEVAHYTHLSLVQYVPASDYDLLAAQARELADTTKTVMDMLCNIVPDIGKLTKVKALRKQAQAVLDAQGREA